MDVFFSTDWICANTGYVICAFDPVKLGYDLLWTAEGKIGVLKDRVRSMPVKEQHAR
jgi:hypothetical protein